VPRRRAGSGTEAANYCSVIRSSTLPFIRAQVRLDLLSERRSRRSEAMRRNWITIRTHLTGSSLLEPVQIGRGYAAPGSPARRSEASSTGTKAAMLTSACSRSSSTIAMSSPSTTFSPFTTRKNWSRPRRIASMRHRPSRVR